MSRFLLLLAALFGAKRGPLVLRIIPDTIHGFNVQRKVYDLFGDHWVTMTWGVTLQRAEEKRDLLQKELMK